MRWNNGDTISFVFEDDFSISAEKGDSVLGCTLLAKSELLDKIGFLNKNILPILKKSNCVCVQEEHFMKLLYSEGKSLVYR